MGVSPCSMLRPCGSGLLDSLDERHHPFHAPRFAWWFTWSYWRNRIALALSLYPRKKVAAAAYPPLQQKIAEDKEALRHYVGARKVPCVFADFESGGTWAVQSAKGKACGGTLIAH